MNFKFFKKKNKPDSDGTLAANEELSYQPLSRSNSQDPQHYQKDVRKPENHPFRPQLQFSASYLEASGLANKSYISNENVSVKDIDGNELHQNLISSNNSNNRSSNRIIEQKTIIIPTISSNSPLSQKKLIKPGCMDVSQPSYLVTSSKDSRVHISDEYTDPFDNIDPISNPGAEGCGYIEPYKAQKLFGDNSQGQKFYKSQHNKDSSRSVDQQRQNRLYDDPWDNSKRPPGKEFATDYDEPWDNNMNTSNENLKPKIVGGNLSLQHDSLDSQSPTSSRSSLTNKPHNRLVRVDSPRLASPRTSPRLDKRLIKPANAGNVERSPPRFDGRLIKAEPSLEELRNKSSSARNSSRGSSGINSPLEYSPSQSPATTLSTGVIGRLNSELHRSHSPLSHHPLTHQQLSKIKSRSLDLRNKESSGHTGSMMKTSSNMPKSASDDQLVQHQAASLLASNPSSLGGVVEYEEPWDNNLPGGATTSELVPVGPVKSHVVHSRSRSYEINVRPSLLVSVHEKSNSLDKTAPHDGENPPRQEACSAYERPWDKFPVVPEDHLKSMQRFQQRKLELHPSEAIDYNDLNHPHHSLSHQSWFHGSITRDLAEQRLERTKEGSYLVRNSESIPNNFSLSLRISCGTIHMVISQRRDGFWILGEFSAPFRSVSEMIEYYSAHQLKISDSHFTNLRFPVDVARLK